MSAETKTQPSNEVESISLLACPFCGSEECYVQEDSHDYGRRCPKLYYYAVCPDCAAQGPQTCEEIDAIKFWNDRTANATNEMKQEN